MVYPTKLERSYWLCGEWSSRVELYCQILQEQHDLIENVFGKDNGLSAWEVGWWRW